MHPVVILMLATLVIVLGLGLWQYRSVKQSKARRGEPDGAPIAKAPGRPHSQ